ncbi:hypothetical protein PanWU01x14_187950 [Parasponia andersonii]|uniref:Transmembrane protein n=1 Tax=Parasponia andersonii TaxID=3476 RepID=A0A2P5C332_PARAD|nr:hypothetical protein PanWU01x14_187950 [Parasponia andersonii]
MRASRLPQAWRSGQGQGAGGFGRPKKGQVWLWTLVFPNWSKYRRNSRTWAPLHMGRESGGRWFLRYWQKVFQSLLFWFSYRLGVVAPAAVDAEAAAAAAAAVAVLSVVVVVGIGVLVLVLMVVL